VKNEFVNLGFVNEALFRMGEFESGNGMCMTANKYTSIRAALCWDIELAKLIRYKLLQSALLRSYKALK